MDREDLKFVGKFTVAIVALVAVVVYCGARMDRAQCFARWDGSGYAASWSMEAGCRLNVDGRMIPDENFRP